MVQRFKDYLKENSLHVFDIDDTLFHTTAKVRVMKGRKHVASLTNSEYNDHQLPPGHHYDFSEFRSAHKFDTESKPVHRMMDKLKGVHATVKAKGKGKVILNTARQDLDDREKFLGTFRKHGVEIDDIHVHRAGNLAQEKGLTISQAKNEVIRQHLNKGGYTHVSLYDDSKTNLNHFLELSKEHPNVRFKAFHVQPDGKIRHHKPNMNEEARYVEYHLHNGKTVILKNPKDKGDMIHGNQVVSRRNVTTVHGTDTAITKMHIIGKSAIKREKDLHHDLTYDELVEK